MADKSISKSFSADLLFWYQNNKRDLPWRRTKDPYKIWVSEIMLQQTTVKAVLGYYDRWIHRFSSVELLAKASREEVLKAWQGLGYYSRARNLHESAKIIVNDFEGHLPKMPEALSNLPGFGPYTVAAVLSIAHGVRMPLVDANVRRVFMRILKIHGHPLPSLDKSILPIIESVIPDSHVGDFNQALMELGALVCRSKEPTCNVCPVSKLCRAFRAGNQEIIPKPRRVSIRAIKAVIGVIKDKAGRILLQKRPEKGLFAGLWEFPGGKVKIAEPLKKALERELREELGVRSSVGKRICAVKHCYTKFKVDLTAFECSVSDGLASKLETRWVRAKDLGRYPMPSGSAKVVKILINGVR